VADVWDETTGVKLINAPMRNRFVAQALGLTVVQVVREEFRQPGGSIR
jgi:hypothetical protein